METMRKAMNYLVRETQRVAYELGIKEWHRIVNPEVRFYNYLEYGCIGMCCGKHLIKFSKNELKKYFQNNYVLDAFAFHEAAHIFVPTERSATGRRWEHHGKAFSQFCTKYGHHPNPWADAKLMASRENNIPL